MTGRGGTQAVSDVQGNATAVDKQRRVVPIRSSDMHQRYTRNKAVCSSRRDTYAFRMLLMRLACTRGPRGPRDTGNAMACHAVRLRNERLWSDCALSTAMYALRSAH